MTQTSSDQIEILQGFPTPFGVHLCYEGFNFSIYIQHASQVTLSLFEENYQVTPWKEIELDPIFNKTGDVWHIAIKNLPQKLLYAYKVKLNTHPDQEFLLLDPYAKGVFNHLEWGNLHKNGQPYRPFGKLPEVDEILKNDRHPNLPMKDLIIYEMHIRGFTQDPSSQIEHPGTFLGVIEKIPYLKELGINAIELLPVFEFNECENIIKNPNTQEPLYNYFGYSTVNFFSLMERYTTSSSGQDGAREFKSMVKALHENGIEIILDVVYNHTFEGNEKGPILSFKACDPKAYYMLGENQEYLNFSGCGNTFNTNHPVTLQLILDSLRYWVVEMHVDGFRFDLATILARAENGAPFPLAPVVEAISKDPILSQTKLIAEAWDAGGLYQVGSFYPGTRWSEWNGQYRDLVRRFIKGTPSHKTAFATSIAGSQSLYGWRGSPSCSVNFITAHDGFSLADLVTFNEKKNFDNGEENRDGFDYNDSWNCGIEGHSTNKKIVFLRERQIRNFVLALILSQGIPMLLMGDEYAHTRHGNNNTWCQDNQLNWFLWDQIQSRPGFYRFVRGLIAFRKKEPTLRQETFLSETDVSWHGTSPNLPEWEKDNGLVAFTLNSINGTTEIYAVFNAFQSYATINIPAPSPGYSWYWVANTYNPSPEDFYEETHRKKLESLTLRIPAYSAYLLKAEKGKEEKIYPQPEYYYKKTEQ